MACDPQTLIEGARCFDCFGSNGVLLDAMEIVLLCAIRDGDTSMACDPQTLVSQSNCIIQCVPLGMMQAVRIYLLCQIAAAGGGGGGSSGGVTCGVAAPVAAPTGTCGVYVQQIVPPAFWVWDGAAWQAIVV